MSVFVHPPLSNQGGAVGGGGGQKMAKILSKQLLNDHLLCKTMSKFNIQFHKSKFVVHKLHKSTNKKIFAASTHLEKVSLNFIYLIQHKYMVFKFCIGLGNGSSLNFMGPYSYIQKEGMGLKVDVCNLVDQFFFLEHPVTDGSKAKEEEDRQSSILRIPYPTYNAACKSTMVLKHF